ncbi:hypothetical protein SD961_06060 [Erwinia sp. MMLR14_017]|uniref:hypothetical protein n=1 Tax=Erwinia sp. MMLR14_017 TaxID=3093842 RepID=UPI00298FE300|nr:hypothetical protein [Erwinia sp. MMLR14_017]MDW8845463.1 hypothetical protein [Erwinia sp. MMLR14_017]
MRNVRVFKWVVLALLIISFYGAWKVITSPIEQTVYKVEKVNSRITLYITEGSAGATTNFVYQFYLVPPEITRSDFLNNIGDKYQPFLSTSDACTNVEINDGAIHLTVHGAVYRFNNGASYSTTIYLNASPF